MIMEEYKYSIEYGSIEDKMSISLSFDEIKQYEKLKLISQLSLVKTKLALFKQLYNCTFKEFEQSIQNATEESFEEWDDYIEWKAYKYKKCALEKKMDELENAKNIKIT